MSRILVTGGSGFVGQSMVRMLLEKGYAVRATSRHHAPVIYEKNNIEWIKYNLEDEYNNYPELLADIQVVVHLASLAHISDKSAQALTRFRNINVEGTRKLAAEAARRGVKRFIFISSIKVNGEKTGLNEQKFSERDLEDPQDSYSISKMEAEQVLKEISQSNQMEYVILRPPLIYGPGVKANFLRLMGLVSREIPLPFATIKNKRSFIYVDNLSHAILTVVNKPEAASNIYLVSDVDVSLPQLIVEIARHLEVSAVLFPFPVMFLQIIGKLTGKKNIIDRLTESLVIDSSKIRYDLKWEPLITFEDGIRNTVDWYKGGD